MKLLDTLIFSFAILFMLIGIHQAMTVGYTASYWLFMLALSALLWYQVRKKNQKKEEAQKDSGKGDKTSGTGTKKRKYKI